MITNNDISSNMDIFCKEVINSFNNQGEIYGTLFFVPKTKKCIQINFDSREDMYFFKDSFFKKYCQTNDISQFFLISEAWLGCDPNIAPTDDPERQEVVICTLIDKTGDKGFISPIKNKKGKRFIEDMNEIEEGEGNVSSMWDDCVISQNIY